MRLEYLEAANNLFNAFTISHNFIYPLSSRYCTFFNLAQMGSTCTLCVFLYADRSVVNNKFSIDYLCLLNSSSPLVMRKSVGTSLHIGLHVEEMRGCSLCQRRYEAFWRRSVVVNPLVLINTFALRQARLLLGWVTVC